MVKCTAELIGIKFPWMLDAEEAMSRAKKEKGAMVAAHKKNQTRLSDLLAISLKADAELLEVLSHGSEPQAIEAHLSSTIGSIDAVTVDIAEPAAMLALPPSSLVLHGRHARTLCLDLHDGAEGEVGDARGCHLLSLWRARLQQLHEVRDGVAGHELGLQLHCRALVFGV